MAAPLVAGLAALIYSVNDDYSPEQVRDFIKLGAKDLGPAGFDNEYGFGRVDANYALLLSMAYKNQSSNQTATAYDNGRSVIYDATSYTHIVFPLGGEIFYRKKTPWGAWEDPILLSKVLGGFPSLGENNYPSIAKYGNYVYITWQRETGSSTYDIWFAASSDNGATWNPNYTYVVTTATNSTDPLPVVEYGGGTFLLFSNYNGIKSYACFGQYPQATCWIPLGTLGSYGANSPSLTRSSNLTALAYKSSTGPIVYNYYNGAWYGNNNLSSIVPGSGNHITPSLTCIPGTSQMHIAWKKLIGSGSSPYDHLIIHRRSTNWYTWPTEWFGTYYQKQEQPSITGLATNKVDLLYQTPPQFGSQYIYKMRFNGTSWSSPVSISNNARYPSVSSGNTSAKYVWTSGSTLPYTINISSETLNKEVEVDPMDYYTRSIALLDSSGNYIELKVHSFGLRLNDGTLKRVEYSRRDLSSFDLTTANAWDSLTASSLSIMPDKVRELILDYSIDGKNINKVVGLVNEAISLEFDILDSRDDLLTYKSQNHLAVSNRIDLVRRELTIPVSSFNYTTLVTNIKMVVKIKNITPKPGTFASLGHIFDYTSLASGKQIEEKIAANETIKDLTIQNYPNPFNPTTKFNVTVPKEGFVTLKIYDILGRKVTELINGKLNIGTYEFQFDASVYPSGIYFYQLELEGEAPITKKMLLVK